MFMGLACSVGAMLARPLRPSSRWRDASHAPQSRAISPPGRGARSPCPPGVHALLAALGAFSLLTAFPRPAEAANGDVVGVSNVIGGMEVSDLTLDVSNTPPGGSFWAVGRLTGKLYHLSLDLTTQIAAIDNPHGIGSLPNFILSYGIAYRPITKSLFVLAQDGGAWKVREVGTNGTEVPAGAFTITPPNPSTAALRGLTFDSLSNRLWYLDANNDVVVSTDFQGNAVEVWPLPGDEPPEMTLLGDGLCFRLEDDGLGSFNRMLYVAYGDIFSPVATRLIQINAATGASTGVEIPLRLEGLGAPLGFQVYQAGLNQRRVAVATSTGKIAQVEQVLPSPIPPSQVRCSLTLTNQVLVEWENHGTDPEAAYGGEIVILRDGVAFQTVAGATRQFTDTTPLEGTSTYALRASASVGGPLSPQSQPCSATVGKGGVVRWIPFPGSLPYDVARDPAAGEVFVTDNVGQQGQGKLYKFDDSLALLGEIPSPWQRPGAITFVPKIKILDVELLNLLAVGRTDGTLLRLIDKTGAEKTTFSLSLDTPSPVIGGLAFNPLTRQFIVTELSEHKIVFCDSTGRFVRSCTPHQIPLIGLDPIQLGIDYDPLLDTLLGVFPDGAVHELYAGGNCFPTGFTLPLGSLGSASQTPDFTGGIQISGNTLLVCGRASKALFKMLIFPAGPPFVRGDVDRNGAVDIADPVYLAKYLFQGGPAISCPDAADANDDAVLDVSDPIYLLFHLFLGGAPPPPPFPDVGSDPTFRDNLGCEE